MFSFRMVSGDEGTKHWLLCPAEHRSLAGSRRPADFDHEIKKQEVYVRPLSEAI